MLLRGWNDALIHDRGQKAVFGGVSQDGALGVLRLHRLLRQVELHLDDLAYRLGNYVESTGVYGYAWVEFVV